MPGEFDIIRQWFDRGSRSGESRDASLKVGIGDDGAVLATVPGMEMVVVTDTLVKGRHYPDDAAPADIGHRALAVNLSDLAAMGAEPRFAFLNLSLDAADSVWLDGFADGFFALADRFGIRLAGGDTTRGPETISVTLLGQIPAGTAMLRSGAQVGDSIAVTGEPGRAAAALACWQQGREIPAGLQQAWRRPEPRVDAGLALRGIATSCIDVSDGLLADLGHVLAASNAGARVNADVLQCDSVRAAWPDRPASEFLFSGDDYELCFTFAPERADELRNALAATATPFTVFGEVREITAGFEVKCDSEWQPAGNFAGWDHFSG